MNTRLFLLAAILVSAIANASVRKDNSGPELPDSVFVDGELMHVQGISLDKEKGCMYLSFTSRFIKTDLEGRIIGSIDRIQGHLGAMTFNPDDRKVYASLECKDDAIGSSISRKLAVNEVSKGSSAFYVAIIDVDRIDRIGMNPEDAEVFKTVCIKEACRDYEATVRIGGKELEHRFGCSGIDGIAIAPGAGKPGGKSFLYIAYGIYGDTERPDNNHQILLRFDIGTLNRHARTVAFGTMHKEGPAKPAGRYFVHTGNTNYGVQNMAYDPHTGFLFLAVYKGKKKEFPNYSLFAVDLSRKPVKAKPEGVPYSGRQQMLSLADTGLYDERTGVRGWNFKWGSTGICALGEGLWYISENARNKETKEEECTARLYRWTGDPDLPFLPAR